jgi:serine/threonine protein kinase
MINHENIVKCYRMLKTSNNIYLAFTYLEGSTLQEILEEGSKALTFLQSNKGVRQRKVSQSSCASSCLNSKRMGLRI